MNNWEDILIKRLRDFRGPEVHGQEAELWQHIDTNLGTPNPSSSAASNSSTYLVRIAVMVVVGTGIAFLMRDNASVQPAEIASETTASEHAIELNELAQEATDDSQGSTSLGLASDTEAQSNLKTPLHKERTNDVFLPAKELSSANALVANSIETDDNIPGDIAEVIVKEDAVPNRGTKGDAAEPAKASTHIKATITESAFSGENAPKKVAMLTTEQQRTQANLTAQEVGNSLVEIEDIGAMEIKGMIPKQLSEVAFLELRKDVGLLLAMAEVQKPRNPVAVRVFSGPTQSRFSMKNDAGRNDFFQHDISAGAGIMFEFNGTQRWSIGMAWHEYVHSLQYTEIEQTQISEYGVIGITIDTSTGDTLTIEEGVVSGLETRIRTVDHHNRFRTVSIPLEWRKVVNKGLWQCGLGVGASLQFRTAAWGSILDEELHIVPYSNEQMSHGRMTVMPTIRAFSGLHVAPGWRFDLGLFTGIHGHKSKAVDEPLPIEFEASWSGQLFNAQLQIGLTHFLPSVGH